MIWLTTRFAVNVFEYVLDFDINGSIFQLEAGCAQTDIPVLLTTA
jgi:hypothetical protein